jgi:hypothetical protein
MQGSIRRSLDIAVSVTILAASCANPLSETLLSQIEDQQGPTITILTPEDGSPYSAVVEVSGRMSDFTDESQDTRGEVAKASYQVVSTAISGPIVLDDESFAFSFSTETLSGSIVVQVSATDWAGNRCECLITLLDGEYGITGFTATAGNREIILDWDPVPGAAAYSLHYTDDNSYPNTASGGANGTVLSAGVEPGMVISEAANGVALNNGRDYIFQLRADFAAGAASQEPTFSDYVHALPLSQFTLAPAATTDLPDRIDLSWSHIPADTPFYLYRSEQEDSGFYRLAAEIHGNSYIDTNVIAGATYYYRVLPVIGSSQASFSVVGKAYDLPVGRHLASVSETSRSSDLAVDAGRDTLYLTSNCTPLAAYDLADIRNPVEFHGPETEPFAPSTLQILGDTLFRSAHSEYIDAIDIDPASPTYLDVVGQIGLDSYDFEISGDYAYCQGYRDLQVFDISGLPLFEAASPQIDLPLQIYYTHELCFDPATERIFLGSYQLSSYDAGFCIYDVGTPALPTLISGSIIDLDLRNVDGIEVDGDYAYLSFGQYGLGFEVVDVSDPPSSYANNFNFAVPEGAVNSISVEGDVLYAAVENSGLHRYSIDPSQYPSAGITLERIFSGPEWALRFRIVGDRAYVVNLNGGFDVVHIGEERFDLANHGAVDGPTVVDGRDVCIQGTLAYLTTRTGILVFDVSNPDSPEYVSSYPPAGADEVLPRGFAMSGGYAFLNDLNTGCHVIDVSDPATLQHVSTYVPETPLEESDSPNYFNYRCAIGGEYLYLSNYGHGISVVSFADPYALVRVSHIPVTGNNSQEVIVREDLLYVTDYGVGIRIFDISDPASPVEVGAYTTDLSPVGIDIEGSLCYIANYHGDLTILDVSDPSDPVLLSNLTIYPDADWTSDDTLFDVEVAHGLAFITACRWGLVIVDVSDPANPVLETIYDVGESEWLRGVRVHDDRLYVAATSRTTIKALNIFDIKPID